jgi:hypothetical protein
MTTMNLNRDEFLLLSRTGRGSRYSTRAGPRISWESEPRTSGRLFRKRARSGLSLRSTKGYVASHVVGPRGRGSTRPSRTLRRIDEQEYYELEFLVGFPAEEETLR